MRRKRINHQVDVFCDMFSGWRLVNDMDTIIQLEQGEFLLDFKEKSIKINNILFNKDLHLFTEISDWFEKDLINNNIEKDSILKATLLVVFKSIVNDGKPKSRAKKIIEINLKMKSSILTDEKEYLSEKLKTMEYHYIDKKNEAGWLRR